MLKQFCENNLCSYLKTLWTPLLPLPPPPPQKKKKFISSVGAHVILKITFYEVYLPTQTMPFGQKPKQQNNLST